jgi:outer membrane lipoprotein-sorting protein
MQTNRRRWAVPAAAAVAVAAVIAVPALASADSPALPERSAEQLATAAAEAQPVPMSGTAVYTARLGLPELPAEMTGGADPLNLLAGSSTIRTWTDGSDRSRVSLLGSTSEYSVVTDGPEAWTYASGSNEVRHITLDEASQQRLSDAEAEHTAAQQAGDVPTPADLAQQLLADAEQHSDIAVSDDVTVAGRAAYELVVTPTTDDTLVDRVVIALDGETLVPLSVQVWSTQSSESPALELAYTDVSFTAPSDAALAFSVPSGAQVEEKTVDLGEHLAEVDRADAPSSAQDWRDALPDDVTVTGEGFSTVVERDDVDVQGLLAGDPAAVQSQLDGTSWGDRPSSDLVEQFDRPDGLDATALYQQLTTEVDGGRMLTSSLGSVLVTDDGRVLAGAVPGEVLLDAAGLR